MPKWYKIKIGDFLTERDNRYKPKEANNMGLNRLVKIDFSGNIYIEENKKTKTNMILIKNGDLVISGINIEKGAIAVYEGKEDLLATIHYSSYIFDKKIINIDYFKWFLKSYQFRNIIERQVKGGIKTELKPKKFLPLEITIPDIETQIEISKRINSISKECEDVNLITLNNKGNFNNLKNTILDLAARGRLVPQNPDDEPASQLLKKIAKEKQRLIDEGKIKKPKTLPPITENEIPYELPDGWKWVRLGDIGQMNPRNYIDDKLEVSFIPMTLISENFNEHHTFEVRKWDNIKKGYTHLKENDVVIAKITPCYENKKSAIMRNLINGYGAGTTELHVFRKFANTDYIIPYYVYIYFNSSNFIKNGIDKMTGTAGHKRVPKKHIFETPFPLPPLPEQKRIVEKVDRLMGLCDELEKNISEGVELSEMLMKSVLQEAFKATKDI